MVIKGGFFKNKNWRRKKRVMLVASLTQRYGFHASLHISIGVCVWFLDLCHAGLNGGRSLNNVSREHKQIVGTSNRSSAPLTGCDFFIQERVPQNVCRTWSVLQLPADYISRISILKGRLLEHTDNDRVLKIISPHSLSTADTEIWERKCRWIPVNLYCVNNNNYGEIRSGCVGEKGDDSN